MAGLCFIVVIILVAAVMIAQSRGTFRRTVAITALMQDVGDGLPPKSDVKFQGVRVGTVTKVAPAAQSDMTDVSIELDEPAVHDIPETVTARVVPSNVFAVPSVQLLYKGEAPALTGGARIAQDRSLATVRLQTSLDQLRRIMAAVGRDGADKTVGMLAVLAEATSGQGAGIHNAGLQLRDIVDQLDRAVSVTAASSMIDSLARALDDLEFAAPELLDALHHAVLPLLAVAQEKENLSALLTGGLHTSATIGSALDNNTDRIIQITGHASPMVAALGDGASHFPQITTSITQLTTVFTTKVWDRNKQRLTGDVIVQLTPNRQYTRADCPRYGDLRGPSCTTGPVNSVPPVAAGLRPGDFQVPPGLASTAIGPVGSLHEQQQIASILGGGPNAASDILLGPVIRGTSVSITDTPNGGGK